MNVPRVRRMEQVTHSCPSQWIGECCNGQQFFIRYRHGILRVDWLKEKPASSLSGLFCPKETIYEKYLGPMVGGDETMTLQELEVHLLWTLDMTKIIEAHKAFHK